MHRSELPVVAAPTRRATVAVLGVVALGCATVPPPATAPAPGPAPAPAPAQPPAETRPPPEPPAVAPPFGPRLAWVNPSRCLKECTYDPSPDLVRINDRGHRDRKGRHRVVSAITEPLLELIAAGQAERQILRVDSGFRSYAMQARLFEAMKEPGRAARPGHSEHQLGTAVDLRLGSSSAIVWLAANAHRFGFVLSYPPGKQRVTGYRPEPWHVRHVGRELAEEIARSGLSLEEFFRSRPELGESGPCDRCPEPASQTRCQQVTAAGACEGTVLTWCYDGALATVDCASSGQTCGRSDSGAHDCLQTSAAQAGASSVSGDPSVR
jgi:zinc D-Ala-D-Ala carboxypeptidase